LGFACCLEADGVLRRCESLMILCNKFLYLVARLYQRGSTPLSLLPKSLRECRKLSHLGLVQTHPKNSSGRFNLTPAPWLRSGASTPLTGGEKVGESEKLKTGGFLVANCLKYRITHDTECDNSAYHRSNSIPSQPQLDFSPSYF